MSKVDNPDSEIPNAVLLDYLKSIQATLARLGEDMREVKERLGILEMQYASLSNRMDRLDKRVERIETRLGLVDG